MTAANSHPGKIPPDYEEVLYWKISDQANRAAYMNLLSIPLAIVSGIVFFILIRVLGNSPKIAWSAREITVFLIGIILVLGIHELLHGAAIQAFGAQAKYGFFGKGLMFYAKAPGYAFKRVQYLIVILSPLVSLSLLACCGIVVQAGTSSVWLFALWGIMNASASSGDIWIMALVLRYPASTFVLDEFDGLRIFLRQKVMKIE